MVLVSSAILTQMTDMDAVFPLLSRSPFTYNYVVKPQDNPLSKLLTGFEKQNYSSVQTQYPTQELESLCVFLNLV